MRKYLILDCPYLCHRAKYSTGSLTYGGNATGVIYGLLKSLSGFQDLFNTSNFVFCWDSNTSKRKEIYPEYKANRNKKEYTDEEIEFDRAFRKQMKKLRTTYLPMIGFRNVFIQRGYESDDIMASIAQYLNEKDEAVIITSDKDLYQCIRSNVSFYNPQKGKILTLQGFKKQYGIHPVKWAMIKSIAGCTTDNVKGIKRVGEKTAIKYLTGNLKVTLKIYTEILCKKGLKISSENMQLVELPMEGTNVFKLRKDKLSEQGWRQVVKLLGMKSIQDRMPFGRRKRKKAIKYEEPDDGYMSLGEEQAMRNFGIRTR